MTQCVSARALVGELLTLTKNPEFLFVPTQARREGQTDGKLYLLASVGVGKALWIT